MEDQINGQRVCLPSLVFTVGLFVASRGRFFFSWEVFFSWEERGGGTESSGLQSSSAPRRDHQHSQVDAREARTFDIVISIIFINIIKKTTIPNWTPVTSFMRSSLIAFFSTIFRISSQDQNPFRKFHKQPELEMSRGTFFCRILS